MSGILSKIEAVDDAEDGIIEPVDAAVDRVFGDRTGDRESAPRPRTPQARPSSETKAASAPTAAPDASAAPASTSLSDDERGTPMPPIGERKRPAPRRPEARKPQPPAADRGPRPNVKMARAEPSQSDQAKPTGRSQKNVSPPVAKAPAQTDEERDALADKALAALKAPAKGGRVPPRLRKRQEQEETPPDIAKKSSPAPAQRAAKAPEARPDAPAKRQAPQAKAQPAQTQPVQTQPAEAKPAKLGRQKVAAQPVAQPPQSPPVQSRPQPSQQSTRQPAPQPEVRQAAPRPVQEAPRPVQPGQARPTADPAQARGRGLRPPPPLPELQGVFEPLPRFDQMAPAVAVDQAAAPPLPPAPPGGSGGGDGGGEPPRPTPIPDSGPPAHEDPALSSLKEATDLSNCLMKLLHALNWRGDRRHIAEALPHFTNQLDVTSFRNIMGTLHYQSRPVKLRLMSIDTRLFPCLFLPEDGDAMVLLGYEKGGLRIFDGGLNEERLQPRSNIRGTAYFFSPVDADEIQLAQSKVGWFRAVSERFRALVYQTLGITFVLNILALVTPLFVMAVYDKVVATGSLPTLAFFAFGVGVAIGCDVILRMIRSKIMAFIGARLDNIVGIAIFHKILFLPPTFTERATIGAQVARIKDFETIRDFFTGPMAMVLFELPFVFIFIITIAALAGPVVFVSIIMMACFFILGLIISPLLRNSVSRAARASSKKQELIVETLSGMRAVKYCGAEERWMERFREFSASASLNSFYTAQLSALMQTISHVLMISAGLGTIIFGVFRVMNGDMSVGGLVASMILVWRVLAPLQTAFVSLTRLTQVKSSISQINNLMNIRGEREQHTLVNPLKQIQGFVTFARVSIRYSPDSDPALVGVSFDLEPGEVLCIVGGNGSGKSTVLKLLAAMYAPQAGSIRIDNMDIRQMDTVELRHAVAYVPQTVQFFYGTIAQNLRLANPTATDEDMYRACDMAGVLDEVLGLSQGSGKWKRDGFEVRIGDSSSGQMPTSLLQRLNLARGYLKRSPIMLFDEPGNGLDFASDQVFMKNVERMRGETTILMVTHRPSHLRLADKILWLEYGNVRAFGPAGEVLKQMPKDFV